MKRVLINKLTEGMVLADDVRLNPNQIFLKKGTTLSPSMITTLYRTNLVYVKIEEASIPGFQEKNVAEQLEPTHLQEIESSEEFQIFREQYKTSIQKLTIFMDNLTFDDVVPDMQTFIKELWELSEFNGTYYSILDYLLIMRDYDDSTYNHCLNVALFCSVFADWLGYSQKDKETAIFCGLLHDIGKLKVPVSILRKPSKLTLQEYDEVKKHAVLGYEILSNDQVLRSLGNHVRNTALMHHERCDGSGYPFGLAGSKLDPFAKMIAIVDVFDAMTSVRVYRPAYCPFKVLAYFERVGYQKYDAQMLMVFMEHMASRYMNYSVKLSNGTVGKIVFINKIAFSKPMVKCGEKYIDLSNESDLFIESVF